MAGLPGLPALDGTLLPKPCTDLWPDSAPEMGVALGGEVVAGQAPGLTPGARVVGQGPTGTSHTVGGVGEGIWFCYLAIAHPPPSFLTVKSHLGL